MTVTVRENVLIQEKMLVGQLRVERTALVNCMTHPHYPCQGESLSDVGIQFMYIDAPNSHFLFLVMQSKESLQLGWHVCVDGWMDVCV